MERIETVLGNVHADDAFAKRRRAHAEAGTLERVVIDAARRRRSRFRATTDAGTDVGIVLDRPALSTGDVLLCEDERMLVVAFEPRDALAVDLPKATAAAMDAAVELGQRVGNQHWDLAVEDGTVYVPLEADRHIVERLVEGIVPGSTVRETTVDAEVFLTDGDAIEHEHGHSQQRERKGEHSHGHSHSHADEQSHSHPNEHSDGHEHHHNHEHDHDH